MIQSCSSPLVVHDRIDLFFNAFQAVGDDLEIILLDVPLIGKAQELTKLIMKLECCGVLVPQPPAAKEESDGGDER